MPPRTPEETSRLCRTAVAYSLLSHEEITAKLTVLKTAKFQRVVAKKEPHFATYDERQDLAQACGVPGRFMEEGWAPLEDDRLARLEQAVSELRVAQGLPPLPGGLGSFHQERGSDDERPEQPQTQPAEDAQ